MHSLNLASPAPTIRVLLIDDVTPAREGIAAALTSDPRFALVGQAGSGHQGLDLAIALEPDVVLLGLHTPGMDGVAVLERLRQETYEHHVLVLTASETFETLRDALAAGARGYVNKRASGQELRDAVATVHRGGSVSAAAPSRHRPARREPRASRDVLTLREQEILRLAATGLSDTQIGARISVPPHAVESHLAFIHDKTGLRRRSELTRWAVAHATG